MGENGEKGKIENRKVVMREKGRRDEYGKIKR